MKVLKKEVSSSGEPFKKFNYLKVIYFSIVGSILLYFFITWFNEYTNITTHQELESAVEEQIKSTHPNMFESISILGADKSNLYVYFNEEFHSLSPRVQYQIVNDLDSFFKKQIHKKTDISKNVDGSFISAQIVVKSNLTDYSIASEIMIVDELGKVSHYDAEGNIVVTPEEHQFLIDKIECYEGTREGSTARMLCERSLKEKYNK